MAHNHFPQFSGPSILKDSSLYPSPNPCETSHLAEVGGQDFIKRDRQPLKQFHPSCLGGVAFSVSRAEVVNELIAAAMIYAQDCMLSDNCRHKNCP